MPCGRVMDILLRETFNDAIKEDQAHGRDRIQAEVARHLGSGVFRFFTRNPRADGKPRFTSLRGSVSSTVTYLVPTGSMFGSQAREAKDFDETSGSLRDGTSVCRRKIR